MISGVETTHPDKGTEMFLYELGVDEDARRQGVATALVNALAALARERGCYGMWVGVDTDNAAARATYRRAGAARRRRRWCSRGTSTRLARGCPTSSTRGWSVACSCTLQGNWPAAARGTP